MPNNIFIQQVTEQLDRLIPKGIGEELRNDIDKYIKAALQITLNKFDLVTREEFEIQKEVLLKTRLQAEALEKRINDLQKQLAAKENSR
jgi:BMFP domain-containing protein YqiC